MLTPAQLAAAISPFARVEIRAGAGTGKTTTLLARALAEAERCDRVRLLTFSRAAMREARHRLEGRADVQVDTCHGLAAALIRRHGGGGLRIVDEVDVQRLHREAKGRREDLTAALAHHGLTRYDELIPWAITLLDGGAGAEECGGSVLLDEGQDLTAQEWALVHALRPDRVTVVGDPAQRIYGWRGAIDPPTDRGWARYDLGQNWRSWQPILDAANRLQVEGAVSLVTARLADRLPWPCVELYESPDREALADLVEESGSCAVLTRTRARAVAARELLRELDVETHAPGLDGHVLDQPAGRRVLDLLRCAADPHDSLSLERVLAACDTPRRTMLALEAVRYERACSLWDAAIHDGEFQRLPDLAQRTLLALYHALEAGLSAGALLMDLPPVLVEVDAALAIPTELLPVEALEWAADPDRDVGVGVAEGDGVYVGTIHAAKGLEWDHVLVLGLEAGQLPLERRATSMDEERRVLYVACTRARESLRLTWAPELTQWGRIQTARPGRFVQELG